MADIKFVCKVLIGNCWVEVPVSMFIGIMSFVCDNVQLHDGFSTFFNKENKEIGIMIF